MVFAQPLARERDAEAVPDDVDLAGAGVREHGMHERAQVGHVRDGRVRDAGPVGRRSSEVALGALVAEPPQLARRAAVIGEVLREVVDVDIWLTRARTR